MSVSPHNLSGWVNQSIFSMEKSILSSPRTYNNITPYKEFYENAQWTTGLVIYPIICTLGIIGNLLIIIVLAQKSMVSSTNIYLCSLAVADMIKLISDFLYFITVLLLEVDEVVGNRCYAYLYPYAHFIFNVSVCVSAWLTVSVAVERFLLVCQPAHAKVKTTILLMYVAKLICTFNCTLRIVTNWLTLIYRNCMCSYICSIYTHTHPYIHNMYNI